MNNLFDADPTKCVLKAICRSIVILNDYADENVSVVRKNNDVFFLISHNLTLIFNFIELSFLIISLLKNKNSFGRHQIKYADQLNSLTVYFNVMPTNYI